MSEVNIADTLFSLNGVCFVVLRKCVVSFYQIKNLLHFVLFYWTMFFTNSISTIRHSLRNLHCQRLFRALNCSNKFYSTLPARTRSFLKQTTNSRAFSDSKEKKRVTIVFQKLNGEQIKRRGFVGETIQDLVATDDPDFPGYGCCCGTLSCSTCHVIFKPEDYTCLSDKPTDEEMDLIAYAPDNCATSRLGCAVELTENMDGMVIQIPALTRDQRDEFDR